ncbi:hypothetical protein AURDEDRAFT_110090 [Auricularia subglabra TFB-10046 SS5]|nr:hypothetical protein AURDEDRAFT_110090 [Auricularia subglabra TFB-10046 SS5]
MDSTAPTTSPTSPTPRVRLPFRASAAPAQSPAWPAHVPQGESKGVRSPSQPRTRSRPGTATSAYSRPSSSRGDPARPSSSRGDPQRPSSSRGADTSTSPLTSHLPRVFPPPMDREEGSGSSTDDSMDPAEPHTPVEVSEPALWPSDSVQLPPHDDVSVDDAAKRESCFTLSAYLTNSPSATWSSSAENTPVIDNVTRFSGQTFGHGADENEALSDRRRAAVVAAAAGRRDSSSGSSTDVPSASQNTRRPALTVMTNDPDNPFAASFRGSTSGASLTSFLSLDSSATSSFDPTRAGGSTSTPPSAYRRGVPASSSSAEFGDKAEELSSHVSPEAPGSSSSPRTASVSPAGKRAPEGINTAFGGHGVSPATTPTRMRAGPFSPVENGGATRTTSTTPTRASRPGTRDGRIPQLASPSAAGHAVPTASSCAAQPVCGSAASPRDAHARYAAQEVQDASGDPSLFLTSASAHSLDAADMRTPIASPSPGKMQALAQAAGTAAVPCDMTFGDPNVTVAPSPTKSMRGMSFLPLEIMPERHGHTRDDSDSFSSSGPHTPVATRIELQPEVRTRSSSSVHTPSPSKSAMLGGDLPRSKTRTQSSSRTPSPARSVDTTGTVDDGDFIVAPPLGPESGLPPLRPWAAEIHKDFGAVRPSNRRPSTANPTGAPSTPPLGGSTGSSRSRPSTAREPASPPMFRTTTQSVPTSVSMDSPPLSDAGSPLMGGQVSIGSSILMQSLDDGQRMQPLSEAARRQVDDGEIAGLGIDAGPGPEDEWSSRYAHALRDSLTARRELSRQDRPARPGTAGGDRPSSAGWHASSSRSATHQSQSLSKPATPDARNALTRPEPATIALASPRRQSDADMLSAAARSFHSIPNRRSRRPGTSAGASSTSPSPSSWKTTRPTTADNVQQQRPATASPVAVLRRDSAASSTATATSETALDIKLPKELSFLTTAYLELWIDQEGFRAVRPTFWLVASRDSNDLAEFKMRPKQSFVFHHAALDSAPVLRRLTLNGDESRDYMSRQASLSVKKNGVYIVSGNEDRGKLSWRFEYLVTDRMDVIGRPMSGEKSFTPLGFCCTPELLMPAHGKKVHLLHVMRKSVTPKLSAAKIAHSASNSVSSPVSSNPTPPPELATVPLLSDTASLGRRRAASHSFGRSTASQTQRPWTANTTVTRPSTSGVQ